MIKTISKNCLAFSFMLSIFHQSFSMEKNTLSDPITVNNYRDLKNLPLNNYFKPTDDLTRNLQEKITLLNNTASRQTTYKNLSSIIASVGGISTLLSFRDDTYIGAGIGILTTIIGICGNRWFNSSIETTKTKKNELENEVTELEKHQENGKFPEELVLQKDSYIFNLDFFYKKVAIEKEKCNSYIQIEEEKKEEEIKKIEHVDKIFNDSDLLETHKKRLDEITKICKKEVRKQWNLEDNKTPDSKIINDVFLELNNLKNVFAREPNEEKIVTENINLIKENLSDHLKKEGHSTTCTKKNKIESFLEIDQNKGINLLEGQATKDEKDIVTKFKSKISVYKDIVGFFELTEEFNNLLLQIQKKSSKSRITYSDDYSKDGIKKELELIIPFQKIIISKIQAFLNTAKDQKDFEDKNFVVKKFSETLDTKTQEYDDVGTILKNNLSWKKKN